MSSGTLTDFAGLVAMGFLPQQVTHALSTCPNVESALEFLLSSSPPEQSESPGPSPQLPAAMHQSYRIRVRKLDNQSVVMGGWLPPNSSLQTLANEIVRLGHAGEGTFSILLPQHQARPPANYNPDAFDTSLESCGVFGAHMTITLQSFMPSGTHPARSAPAKEWSPPPPPQRGIAPRGRINSQKVKRSFLHIAIALELFVTIPLHSPCIHRCLRKIWKIFTGSSLGSLGKNQLGQFPVRLKPSTRASAKSTPCMNHTWILCSWKYLDSLLLLPKGINAKRIAVSLSGLTSVRSVLMFSLVSAELNNPQAMMRCHSLCSSPTNFRMRCLRARITTYGGRGNLCFKRPTG